MDLVQFFARFHVLVLHLPIGILMLSAIAELAHTRSNNTRPEFLNWVWFWGAISATAACVLGWMLSLAEGYNADAIFIHRNFGVSVALTAFVCWWMFKRSDQPSKFLTYTLSILQLGLLFLAGHYGANMTHGETFLVEHAPDPIRKMVGLPAHPEPRPEITSLEQAMVFEDVINPMLQKRCSSCHNDAKQKGKLNLASLDGLFNSGKSGQTIVKGNAQESELFRRITLDHDDDEFMPAEGKTPLTDEQVLTLEWWIDSGAPTQGLVIDYLSTKQDKALLVSVLDLDIPLFAQIEPVSDANKLTLNQAGFVVKDIAQQVNYLDLNLSISRRVPDESARQLLKDIAPNIAYLNLAKLNITPELMSMVSHMKNLQRLRLDGSNVSSSDLAALGRLEKLRYLNLYNSEVDDSVFDLLTQFPALEKLYLNSTKVSEQAVAKFKNNHSVQLVYQANQAASINKTSSQIESE